MARPAKRRKFHPLPAPGDIVWCAFPQLAGVPGPKKRPALVARVASATHEVSVVYGTSQKTDHIYPTEVVLDPTDPGFAASGLSYRTKFDVAHQVQLPFDSDWFDPAPGPQTNIPLPKMGILHPSYMPAIASAVKRIRT
ncbi:type II toxin-antitoxin system PemK/MazF family toxin [Duganella vulcania]|uniref:Type II toxin-antitoxin system PemK/MazF family toxin n=1 Tax=Duganella vulcania TaxID=2692166 RepID=A0A845GVP2_9BURK|nr:hypothetical protein [Duganella vulcania]